jgi:protoheme IX farnesyltransferase
MTVRTETWEVGRSQARRRAADFVALAKPRMVLMIVITTLVGFYLGSGGGADYGRLLATLLGTALAAGGTLALNQFIEREADARMERTRLRPLPDGRLTPVEGLAFGAVIASAGLLLLALAVSPLSGLVAAVVVSTYLFLYTPLKRRTPLCSVVGAVPGALPPVIGWTAARGDLTLGAWLLFAILFLWQIPHSLAIGRVYRDDYARAGIRVLPVVDRDGPSTGLHVLSNCLALLPVALLPTLIGLAGPLYFLVALVLGLGFLWSAIGLARTRSATDARRVLVASLVYLPVLLGMMALDKLAS